MNGWLEPPPQRPRQMGCIGKGCLILSGFIFFLLLACAIGIFFGMKRHSAVLHSVMLARRANIIAAEPSPVPPFEATRENIEQTRAKCQAFRDVPADVTAELSLTADDLNNLIAADHQLRGKIFVSMENNQLRVQTSLPLREYIRPNDYYLNGEIVWQSDGPHPFDAPPLRSVTVNGQPLPSEALDWKFRGRPLRDYLTEYKKRAAIDAAEVRDGKLILSREGR